MKRLRGHLGALVMVGILLYAGLCAVSAVATAPDRVGLYFAISAIGACIGVVGVVFGFVVGLRGEHESSSVQDEQPE